MIGEEIDTDFDPSDPEQDGTRRKFYDEWYRELVGELTGYASFKNETAPYGNGLWGSLTGSEERRLNMLICQKMPGMTLELWQAMGVYKRITYLRSALKLTSIENDNYVGFGCVWPEVEQFNKSYSKAKTYLDKTPAIRQRKPTPQRLEVHAGDWIRHWSSLKSNQLAGEPSDEVVDAYLAGVAERQKQIDAKRAN